jgi:hypothetical protein
MLAGEASRRFAMAGKINNREFFAHDFIFRPHQIKQSPVCQC